MSIQEVHSISFSFHLIGIERSVVTVCETFLKLQQMASMVTQPKRKINPSVIDDDSHQPLKKSRAGPSTEELQYEELVGMFCFNDQIQTGQLIAFYISP